jgi:glycosyltransferase involved in cell wall biosynthesis
LFTTLKTTALPNQLRIAIVHDWLTVYAGAEKVLEQMLLCYPQADIFSLVDFLPDSQRAFLQGKKVTTSFIQQLPFAKAKYRAYLPLMPLAIEQFDLSAYDLILSSSHAVAKGVLTGPDQLHICMCYSPVRYAWDLQHQYLKESGLDRGIKGWFAKYLLHRLRIWDLRTANGVDQFIAISKFVARRIYKVYRRNSVVIYPPVATDDFVLTEDKENFYLTASRMVPYKKIELIVQAFASMPNKRLIVIGAGPDFAKIQKIATSNITMMGYQSHAVLLEHLQKAKAFIFAAEEDFGIAPLEAQACGTPVIAYGKGGALETIRGAENQIPRTGVFFDQQSVPSLCAAIDVFEKLSPAIAPHDCREQSLKFSPEIFRKALVDCVDKEIQAFYQG